VGKIIACRDIWLSEERIHVILDLHAIFELLVLDKAIF
jgi:hypothetical protein